MPVFGADNCIPCNTYLPLGAVGDDTVQAEAYTLLDVVVHVIGVVLDGELTI